MARLVARHPPRSSLWSDLPAPPMALGITMTEAGEAALTRLRQWPGEHRIAVGLSGGVDSSLTAALLVEAGWEVEGLTLWLMSGKGACCAEGLVDAAGICEQLGIPHHVVDTRCLLYTSPSPRDRQKSRMPSSA